jgi:hypothetical protein
MRIEYLKRETTLAANSLVYLRLVVGIPKKLLAFILTRKLVFQYAN